DVASIILIKRVLDEFQPMSGLATYNRKSEVFFSGVNEEIKAQVLSIFQFKEGNLLVRYLGVPLISGKLTIADCKPLLDRKN
ncbi:putative RNA-directed DNA polymerase, partial [Fagus crenata]